MCRNRLKVFFYKRGARRECNPSPLFILIFLFLFLLSLHILDFIFSVLSSPFYSTLSQCISLTSFSTVMLTAYSPCSASPDWAVSLQRLQHFTHTFILAQWALAVALSAAHSIFYTRTLLCSVTHLTASLINLVWGKLWYILVGILKKKKN